MLSVWGRAECTVSTDAGVTDRLRPDYVIDAPLKLLTISFNKSMHRVYIRDDATTSRFIIGGTIGEAVLPVVIGHTMSYFGPVALLYDTLVIAVTMMVLYVTSHCYLVRRRIEASGADYLGAYATLPISEEEKTQDLSV